MRAARATFAICLALTLGACAKTATVSHPGAVNAFDSNTYDALVTAQGAIDTARPLATTATQKAILNKVIASYQEAKAAYLVYHNAAVVGGAPDTTTLAADIVSLTASTANLVATIKGAQ